MAAAFANCRSGFFINKYLGVFPHIHSYLNAADEIDVMIEYGEKIYIGKYIYKIKKDFFELNVLF
jgi:hypothetical protein